MADGLFLPDGTFLSFNAAELTTQLATRQNAGVTLGELEGWLNTLPDPDPVLRKRGEDATVLDDLSADDQVTTAMLSRKNRVLNCPDFTLRAGARTAARPPPEAEALYRPFCTGPGADQPAHRHFRHPGRSLLRFHPAGTDLEAR